MLFIKYKKILNMEKHSKTHKILMIVGDFVEDYEVIVPFQGLQIYGHTIHAVCQGRKKAKR